MLKIKKLNIKDFKKIGKLACEANYMFYTPLILEGAVNF